MADVNVLPGLVAVVATGGTSVAAIPTLPNGGFITNPMLAADQGLATPEPLYINPISAATLAAYGTTFALAPGASWQVIPGQPNSTFVNAATSGHRFSVVYW